MKIVTSVVNNPDFIEIQYHTLRTYCKCEYEFIVFNDAKEFPDFTNGKDVSIKAQIEIICKKLNIECINIPNDHHLNKNMSNRHADTFNHHVLKYQLDHPDQYLILDSDMFLIDDFDLNKFSTYYCAIVLQCRDRGKYNYPWPGLCYMDFTRITHKDLLNWGTSSGCDSGGMMQSWLTHQMLNEPFPDTDKIRWTSNAYHTSNVYFIKHLSSCSWNKSELPECIQDKPLLIEFLEKDCRNKGGNFYCEIYDNIFLHYRAGGNWQGEGMELHRQLTQRLKNALI